jgi:MarR family transcriptional regulator, organic hydroperoxide resistance regulator
METDDFKKLILDYTKKITDSTNSAFNSVGSRYGLTMMQLRLLMELQSSQRHTVGSLAAGICMAGANISNLCKKLEQQGFLQKKRDPNDERVVILKLTDKGEKTVKEIDSYFNERISKCMADEAEETFVIIINGMEKLNFLLQSIVADEENK